MKLPQLSLRELFLLVALAGLSIGWWRDHRRANMWQSRATWAASSMNGDPPKVVGEPIDWLRTVSTLIAAIALLLTVGFLALLAFGAFAGLPYEPPKEVGPNPLRAGWSFARTAVVLALVPVTIVLWFGGVLLIGWILMVTDFPPLAVRKAIGADVAMAGIGIIAAVPVLALLAVVLRVSRQLSPRRLNTQ